MPHKDSGAGNGQQVSLIVGLGNYSGGQLGVEGTIHDIQYMPLEFDGWKQRHWTLPFVGERFSLVWFSPLGCEINDTGKYISERTTLMANQKQQQEIEKGINTTVALSNGVIMPLMGIGTFHVKGQLCTELIHHALSLVAPVPDVTNVTVLLPPVLLIDTAELYNNHRDINKGLATVDRSTYFLTSKLSPKNMSEPSRDVPKAYQQTIRELFGATATDVLDCYLMHWVAPHGASHENKIENNEIRIQCWLAMEQLYWKGLVRSIGVSNFTVQHLNLLLNDTRITVIPHVNQVEIHPLYNQCALRKYCKGKGITVQAYASLGQSNLLTHPNIVQAATQVNLSVVQLLLYYGIKHLSLPIIPRTSSIEHLEANITSMMAIMKMSANDCVALTEALKTLEQECSCMEDTKMAWDSSSF